MHRPSDPAEHAAARVDRLPALSDFVTAAEWEKDVISASAAVHAATPHRILRDDSDGLVVLGHEALRHLSQDPAVGNTPLEFLEARAAERARRRGAAEPQDEQPTPFARFLHNQVFTHNPPVHTASRRLVGQPLLPRPAGSMRDAAGRAAAELLVSLAGAEDVDLVRDFASPFVCYFWAEQLGMPVEVADQLPEVMDAMNAMFLFDPGAEDVARLRAATARYVDLVSESIDASDVATPVLDHLRAHLSTTEGLRDPVTVGRFVASNYFDGFHTAGVAVASTLRQLLDSPTSLRLVRDDPGLAGAAFQESTRLATPVMVSTRLTLAEVELGGLRIPPQTPLAMVWAAGNRDPDVFADPHVFDLHRGAGLASTFGGGAHLCPGRNIARVLAEAAVTAFVDPSLEVVPRGRSGGWIPGSAMRVLTTLPVSVRVRDA